MLTEQQIQFLNDVCTFRWSEENGIINVTGKTDISEKSLTEIPVQFGQVTGYFSCLNNKLTTLLHGPKKVGGFYGCTNNKLKNLIGAPEVCNNDFYCNRNLLTSLEGCPRLIRYNLSCKNNPNLNILYGIGRVNGVVEYDNRNDLNEWIIEQARKNIFTTYEDISRWIKDNNRLEFLLGAKQEIRQHFSPRILHLVDSGVYNESKILDYKKFSRLC